MYISKILSTKRGRFRYIHFNLYIIKVRIKKEMYSLYIKSIVPQYGCKHEYEIIKSEVAYNIKRCTKCDKIDIEEKLPPIVNVKIEVCIASTELKII